MPDRRAVATLLIAVGAQSRGRVMLGSADAGARPVIDPAYLADERDLDILVAGVRIAREMAACEPLAGIVGGAPRAGRSVSRAAAGRCTCAFCTCSTSPTG